MVVAVLALALAVTGVGYAATKIGTKEIQRGAVTTKKLHKKAVTGGKLESRAVKAGKIQDGAVKAKKLDPAVLSSIPAAGVSVRQDGAIITSFNRLGGAVTVRHINSPAGFYIVDVPGLTDTDPFVFGELGVIPIATLAFGGGEIEASQTSGREAALAVQTSNSAGAPADRAFNWTVYVP
jgi:hypothetical protein